MRSRVTSPVSSAESARLAGWLFDQTLDSAELRGASFAIPLQRSERDFSARMRLFLDDRPQNALDSVGYAGPGEIADNPRAALTPKLNGQIAMTEQFSECSADIIRVQRIYQQPRPAIHDRVANPHGPASDNRLPTSTGL